MEIEKLENLSCLKIAPDSQEKISHSLEGVIEMLQEIEGIVLGAVEEPLLPPTIFREQSAVSQSKLSLHIEEELFLAPKVIKKDI